MKRAILLRFVAILMLALAVSSVFSYYFIGKNMLKNNRESMINTIHVVDYSLDYEGDLQEQLSSLHKATMDEESRITIISEDGTVVADTEIEQVGILENLLEREEVKEALADLSDFSPDFSSEPESWFQTMDASPAGYLKTAGVAGASLSGTRLRAALSLRSACFTVEFTNGSFLFTCRGWGHGVGMSQAGASFLAQQGASCDKILSHYYPGTTLSSPSK